MSRITRTIIQIFGIVAITAGGVAAYYHVQSQRYAMALVKTDSLEQVQKPGLAGESHEADRHQPDEVTRDPNRLWCREHNVYEDECGICHPEIASRSDHDEQEGHDGSDVSHQPDEVTRDPNRLWCREHNVYEDECRICHPEIASRSDHDEQEGHDVHDHGDEDQEGEGALFCTTHQVPELACGICQPQRAVALKPGESMLVRLASRESAQKVGIQTGKPQPGSVTAERYFLCQAVFNQNRFAHISPLAGGVIRKVMVDVGDIVEEGQVLLEMASPEIATAKSQYLQALDRERLQEITYRREKDLAEKNISARQDFQLAEAEYQLARTETQTAYQQLLNFGLSPAEVETIKTTRSTSSTLSLRAPFRGTAIEKHAVTGEAVEPGESIVEIADLSTLWLEITIPETQLHLVNSGNAVRVRFDALPDDEVEGTLQWIASRLDSNTRTVNARAVIPNPKGRLKQGMFGRAYLLMESEKPRVVVPIDSLQHVDGKPFVFLRKENDLFELRHVIPGTRDHYQVEIKTGLTEADDIVVANAFVLKSEFLKSRFGAGCAHD